MNECKECNGSGFIEFKLNPSFVDGSIKTGKIKCQCAKPDFDITKHEWDRDSIIDTSVNKDTIEVYLAIDTSCFYLEKADAIALAKHFKLTPEDLT